MNKIKEIFSGALEEVLQCELDEKLGYDKHQQGGDQMIKTDRRVVKTRKARLFAKSSEKPKSKETD